MVRKSLYTKKLGIEVARSARPLNPIRYHVISGATNGWTVVPEGSVRGVKASSQQRLSLSNAHSINYKIPSNVSPLAMSGAEYVAPIKMNTSSTNATLPIHKVL